MCAVDGVGGLGEPLLWLGIEPLLGGNNSKVYATKQHT